jgi:hypothetical protein
VPFTWFSPEVRPRHGTAIGVHERSGIVMVRWEGSKKPEGLPMDVAGSRVLVRLEPSKIEEYQRLRNALRLAHRAVYDFEARNTVNLKVLINEQIAEASDREEAGA